MPTVTKYEKRPCPKCGQMRDPRGLHKHIASCTGEKSPTQDPVKDKLAKRVWVVGSSGRPQCKWCEFSHPRPNVVGLHAKRMHPDKFAATTQLRPQKPKQTSGFYSHAIQTIAGIQRMRNGSSQKPTRFQMDVKLPIDPKTMSMSQLCAMISACHTELGNRARAIESLTLFVT